MTDQIKYIREAIIDSLAASDIIAYDAFAPDDAPAIFGVITQMTATHTPATNCGGQWSVLVDLDMYQDFGRRGGNLPLDDVANDVLTSIEGSAFQAITGFFEVRFNSTSTNAVFLINRYMYRRNFNFTVLVDA